MATDVIIEPGSGQIYWNDSTGSPQSISIKGDAQNTISVVGYSGAFSPGSSAGGTFVIASFNDNAGTSAFVPGTTNYDLGSSTYRWSVYGYTGNFSSDVIISSSTNSTSVTTGALRVNGGVGISGRMYFNTAAMGTTGIASPPTFAFIGSTGDPIYLQVLEDNSIAFEGSQGQLFSITPNLSTGYIYSVNDITGIPLLRANANANVTANEFGGNFGIGVTNPGYKLHVVGSVGFTSVTSSTSSTTGTLVVSGGVGIGQTLNIAGRLNLWNSANTYFTSFNSTATGNTVYNLPATTPSTGSSVLQSDSVGNLSWVGFVPNSAATATTAQNINTVNASTSGTHHILFSPVNGGSGVAVSSDSGFTVNPATNVITANTFSGNISATGTTSGFVGVTNATSSTSTTTGALVVSGGVGIAQTAFIGGNVNILGSTASTYMANGALTVAGGVGISGQLSFNRAAMGYTGIASNPTMAFIGTTGSPITLTVLSDNGLQFEGTSGKLFGINNNLSTGWIFNVGDISGLPLIRANADGTVAMGEFAGNIGIGMSNPAYKFHVIGSVGFTSVTASTNPTSGTLIVSGGVGIGQSLNVGGRLHLWNATNTNFTAFLSSATGNHTYTLPANVPSTGTSVLQSDTSGILSWVGFSANSASIATTAQNLNTVAATTSATHYLLFSPVNGASGVAVSSDTELSYNPSTNVLSATVFSGNVTATAVTSTNFYGTLTGNVTGTSTTSQNVNTVAATTAATHYLTFSPVNGASGVALSSDANLTFNPSTNILTTDIFSGNISATAATATNFYGTLTGNVTGNLTGTATTAQNINLASGANNSNHSIVFSLTATGSGVALSSDSQLTYNPASDILSASVFSGNVTGTAITATNFYGTLTGNVTGNVTGTATTATNVNLAAGANNANHSVVFSLNATGAGVGLSSDAGLQYNPSTNVLSADVFSGNVTGTAITATNFYGTFQGSSATAVTSQNINTTSATTAASHYILFSPVNATTSGVAVSSDASLQYNPATNVLTVDVFNGNLSATAATATNFYGTHIGNVTGNVTGFATTSQNINTVAATTSATHYLTFSPVNGASGIALSSDANLTFNPSTNVLTTDVFSGNVSATAITSTNFYGTLVGNVTGTATTSQNINLAAGANNSNHSVVFSLNATGSGVALSSDAGLQYNPSTNVLTADVFSGNVSATAVTATNFFGTFQGSSATAVTSQNINTTSAATSASHYILFSPVNATTSGVAVSSDASLQFNPATNVLTVDVFSGNASGTAATFTNFFGTHVGNVTGNVTGTATTSQNVNTVAATTSASHFITFSPVNGASGVALSSDANLTFNPSTNVLTTDVFSGNVSATAVTSTNFFGTLTGNVTGNLTGTATTAQNVNLAAGANASNHSVVFSLNATGTGIALSSDAGLQYNPATNVLTADVFSGNVSGTAITATNFFGTFQGSAATAVTAQNVNVNATTINATHFITFAPASSGSGLANSTDTDLTYNPGSNVLSAGVFSGNLSATAATATNFFGTLTGNVTGNLTGTATTSQNINTTSATTAGAHYVLFSPVNATASGVAVSSDATLQFNPATNVLTTDVFSGNLSATAATATNFFGTLVGNSSTATTAANMNVVAASTNSAHFITFSPASSGSGLATSADADLTYNPSTNVLTAGVFSGNLSATAATATNFFGTLVGNSSTATTAQNVNLAAGGNASNHSIVFSLNATGSGVALSSDTELQYNPSTNALSVGTGNIAANSVRIGNTANTIDTSSGNLTLDSTGGQINLNDNVVVQGNLTVQGTTLTVDSTITTIVDPVIVLGSGVGGTHSTADNNQDRGIEFRYSNGGTAVTGFFGFQDIDYKFRYIPNATLSGTNVYSGTVGVIVANIEGNVSGTAVTATNFYGTLVGNTATATTSQNINTTTAATASAHYILFSPVNATASGVAVSSDSTLQFNPGTNVLTTDVFSGNLSATAATATNFFGTHVGPVTGNVTGTATTSLNINTVSATTSASHFLLFSPVNGASGVAVSSDTQLFYNPATDVLSASIFAGNLSATAATATNFFGTLTGNVTGNVTGTATTAQNVNVVAATTSATHFVTFSPASSGSGLATSADTQLTYNPATDILSAATFSGNVTGTAVTATNFFGALTGNVSGTATTSQNVNTVSATTSASHFLLFSPVNGASGVAVSSDTQLTYNPATDILSATTFTGNLSATAATATNFFGTLVGNSSTATTASSLNINVASTNSTHYITFTTATTGSGLASSTDADLSYNPGSNVLTAGVFSGNVSGSAITATNFFGTLTGNVTGNLTGTATTAQNINVNATTINATHFITFSPASSGSGLATSTDTDLSYNPGTNVLTSGVFSGNVTGTAVTATNFFGTLTGNVTGNVTGTATTAQNVNLAAGANNSNHSVIFSLNATGTGVGLSSDAGLQYNPSTNVLTADVFSGNASGTAATYTNFFGTHVGNVTGNVTGTATTSQNVNTVSATTSAAHFLTFSPVNGASGVALSSDAQLTYNPATDVLSATTFSGNVTGTAITATNFFGTLVGSVGTATTSQNINTTAATTAGVHYLLFSPVNATTSGVAVSSDATLQFNPGTNVLTTDIFSGNLSATAATATNFFGTLNGSVVGTATTAQNINVVSGSTGTFYPLFTSATTTASGIAVSINSTNISYNFATNTLTAGVFSGNFSGTAATATNFFGTFNGNVVGTATTSQNVNTVSATTSASHFLTFSPVNGASGVALSSDAQLTYNPATDVLSSTTFSGNVTGTAITATNFFGTLTGNVTGNLTGTATTAQNVNVVAATTSATHFITFSPASSGSGLATSADTQLTYNPATDVLSAATFSGNLSGTAVTATNFFGTLTGNVTGTATTAQNINLAAGANNSNHSVIFSLNATGTGVGLSSDAGLQYNPSTNVLTADVFSGNFTGTAATATNFFGTHVGNVTGNVTGTATTAQNVNVNPATTSTTLYLLGANDTVGSGLAVSSNSSLSYNTATNQLTTPFLYSSYSAGSEGGEIVLNKPTSGTGFTTTITMDINGDRLRFFETGGANRGFYLDFSTDSVAGVGKNIIGSGSASGSATTSYNLFTVAASTNATHYITFSPSNGGSGQAGVAVSSDTELTYNPSTNVLSSSVFSGNLSATASTTGFARVSNLTNTTSSTTGALVVSGGVGIGGSINVDGTVKLNYTSGTAFNIADRVTVSTSNNFEGLNVNSNYQYAFNVQDKANNNRFTIDVSNNKTYLWGNSASHELRLYNANQSTYTGFAASNVGTVTYTLPAGDGSSGQVLTTNGSSRLYWSTPSAGSGSGSSGVNSGGQYQIAYYASTGASVDGSSTFTNNTSTGSVSITHATSSTATNVGALVVTGGLGLGGNAFIGGTVTITNSTQSTSTAVGAVVITGGLGVGGQINAASLVTSGNAVISGNLQFNGNGTFGNLATADTIAFNARSITDFNPNATNTYDLGLNTLVWRNLFANFITGSAVTATNFYGSLAGNVTGTATTSQNINTVAATTSASHFLLFSPVNGATGVAVSSDTQLTYNPATDLLSATTFSGNVTGTAVTATNFFGTLTGNVTGNLTGTATTAQNVNTVSANTNATHFLTFSPVNGGSGVALSTDTNLTFNSLSNVLTSGVFSGNLSATAATSGLFAVGNLTYSASNLLASFQSSVNSYNQVVIQNSNNGANASSDLVVNNDISTDSGAYGAFGMNSSGFTGSGSTNIPNAVYVTSTTAELVLGTTTNNRVRFVNENIDTFQVTSTGSSVYTTTATVSKNSGAFVVAGGAAIGLSLSVGQGIQLYNSTNGNHTGFKAGATSSNSVYTLPLAYPSTGSSILQSDTSGNMIWVNAPTGGSATPAGNTTEIQYNNGGSFGGATGLTWQNAGYTLQINSNASHTTSTQVGFRLENGLASGGQATRWSPSFEMIGRSGIANVYYSRFTAEVVPSGPATYASALRFKYSQDQGTASYSSNIFSIHSTLGIGIGGSTVSSNFMSYIRAHESQAADISYKLPLALPGTGASFLQCDTSGNMSWVNSPGGGSGSPAGSAKQIQFNNSGSFGGAQGFEYITVGGSAVTVSMFSVAGGGYTSGLWVNVLSASSTKIGIGLSNPQYELEINGELSATNKSFVIDHPTKSGMKLRYGSLEGPENGVYVRGELKGSNIITVPDHWIGLVHEDSYTVHLTPIGRYSQLYVEKIENYNVHVADNCMNPIHCYYSVWAERKDIPKLIVEY